MGDCERELKIMDDCRIIYVFILVLSGDEDGRSSG